MYYWNKKRNNMIMAVELIAMHRAKKIPREVTVYGPPDDRGKREILGTETLYDEARIPRQRLHQMAMGSR